MKTYTELRQELNEAKFPMWVRVLAFSLTLKIKNISDDIEKEQDEVKRDKLLSRQQVLIGYQNMLQLGIETNDKKILSRVKSVVKI